MASNSGIAGGSLLVGHRTDTGQRRTTNEDAYAVILPPDAPSGVDVILAVADGMGGHQAGEVASALAIKTISRRLGSKSRQIRRKDYREALKVVVEQANQLILSEAHGESQGMGTTLTLAAVRGGRLHLAHVGDSRAYLLRKGVLRQLTQDHSWVGEELRAGRISAEEAESHPRRNLLTRALGTGESVVVDTDSLTLKEGDRLLLCSDGLHGVVTDEQIQATLNDKREPKAACDALVDLVNNRGGPDNVTVVIARIGAVSNPSNAITIPLIVSRPARPTRRWAILAAGLAGVLVALALWWLASEFLTT